MLVPHEAFDESHFDRTQTFFGRMSTRLRRGSNAVGKSASGGSGNKGSASEQQLQLRLKVEQEKKQQLMDEVMAKVNAQFKEAIKDKSGRLLSTLNELL